jgi:hypothetical protein
VLTHARTTLAFDGCEFNLRAALRAIARSIREATCGLAGHDYLRKFSTNRIFLQCASCGHETRGWEIEVTNRGKAYAACADEFCSASARSRSQGW